MKNINYNNIQQKLITLFPAVPDGYTNHTFPQVPIGRVIKLPNLLRLLSVKV